MIHAFKLQASEFRELERKICRADKKFHQKFKDAKKDSRRENEKCASTFLVLYTKFE